MNKKVTSKQVMYASVIMITGTSLLTKQLYTVLKNDAWIGVITGFILSALIYSVYAMLALKFQGKSLNEINDIVFGRIVGKIITVLYLYFLITYCCLNTNITAGFVKTSVLPNTPTVLTMALFVAVCVWATRKGPAYILSYSALFVYVSTFVILINGLLLYKVIDFRNFMPTLTLPLKNYLVGTDAITSIPLCDPFILIMLMPNMEQPREFGKSAIKGLTIGSAVYLLIVVRDIAVLGQMAALEAYPSYSTVRLIDVGDILTRMDIIYISVLLAMMFYKVAITFYISVSGVRRLLKLESQKPYGLIFGALLIVYSSFIVRSSSEHSEWLRNGTGEIFQSFFMIMLPVLTLAVAVSRGFFSKNGGNMRSVKAEPSTDGQPQ